MLKWLLIILAILAGILILAAIVGSLLPKGHVASRSITFKRTPDEVWAVISDFENQPSWRTDIIRVERMPDQNGHEVWCEVQKNGQRMPLETVEAIPGRKLVGKIADPKLPFGGTWTYELEPASADGRECRLTITERGEVYNPIFRLVSKFMDPRATMDTYLTALGRKFGQEVELRD